MRILLLIGIVYTRRFSRLQKHWTHICKMQVNQPLKHRKRQRKVQAIIYHHLEPSLAPQLVKLMQSYRKSEQWQPRNIKNVWQGKIKIMATDRKTTISRMMKKPIQLLNNWRSRNNLVETLRDQHSLQKFHKQLYWPNLIIHIRIAIHKSNDHLVLQQEHPQILLQHIKEWTVLQIRVQVIMSLTIL